MLWVLCPVYNKWEDLAASPACRVFGVLWVRDGLKSEQDNWSLQGRL